MAEHESNLTEQEKKEVEEHSPPAAKVVHAAVSKQGDDELDRPVGSLFWSAVAAGIAIMTSRWISGALHHYVPEAPWKEALVAFGYPFGFLIVVLGRMQLFTEQTVVAILPLARDWTWANFRRVARLWSIVLLGNLLGTAAMALLAAHARLESDEVLGGMLAVAGKLQEHGPLQTMLLAIPAGFIMAAVAWIRSAENELSFWIVVWLTLAIGLGGFAHVVVGSAESWLLFWRGEAGIGWVFGGFLLPALAGNVIGGTGLFALLAHAQVRQEI
jgi:formate/nitrite transporter FocA (FNT family)